MSPSAAGKPTAHSTKAAGTSSAKAERTEAATSGPLGPGSPAGARVLHWREPCAIFHPLPERRGPGADADSVESPLRLDVVLSSVARSRYVETVVIEGTQ